MENEYIMEVQRKYDELMIKEENRGISYGELFYIENLNKKELLELEKEIDEKL